MTRKKLIVMSQKIKILPHVPIIFLFIQQKLAIMSVTKKFALDQTTGKSTSNGLGSVNLFL